MRERGESSREAEQAAEKIEEAVVVRSYALSGLPTLIAPAGSAAANTERYENVNVALTAHLAAIANAGRPPADFAGVISAATISAYCPDLGSYPGVPGDSALYTISRAGSAPIATGGRARLQFTRRHDWTQLGDRVEDEAGAVYTRTLVVDQATGASRWDVLDAPRHLSCEFADGRSVALSLVYAARAHAAFGAALEAKRGDLGPDEVAAICAMLHAHFAAKETVGHDGASLAAVDEADLDAVVRAYVEAVGALVRLPASVQAVAPIGLVYQDGRLRAGALPHS